MEYLQHLVIIISIFAVLGLSLNLVVGYTGLISLAHAAFFGIGAYTTAILTTQFDINFFITIPIAIAISVTASFLIGLALSKFKGDYYALVSLGFGVIAFAIFANWFDLTGGPLGIHGIDAPRLFGISFDSNWSYLLLALLLAVAVYGISRFIVNSPFGRVIKAIREDEQALQIFGYNAFYYKLTILAISAAMAAAAGSLFASYLTAIDPSLFTISESVFLLAIVALGGLASLRGAILRTLVLVLIPELLRFVGFPSEIVGLARQLVFGIALVLLMIYRPQGLLGKYSL